MSYHTLTGRLEALLRLARREFGPAFEKEIRIFESYMRFAIKREEYRQTVDRDTPTEHLAVGTYKSKKTH